MPKKKSIITPEGLKYLEELQSELKNKFGEPPNVSNEEGRFECARKKLALWEYMQARRGVVFGEKPEIEDQRHPNFYVHDREVRTKVEVFCDLKDAKETGCDELGYYLVCQQEDHGKGCKIYLKTTDIRWGEAYKMRWILRPKVDKMGHSGPHNQGPVATLGAPHSPAAGPSYAATSRDPAAAAASPRQDVQQPPLANGQPLLHTYCGASHLATDGSELDSMPSLEVPTTGSSSASAVPGPESFGQGQHSVQHNQGPVATLGAPHSPAAGASYAATSMDPAAAAASPRRDVQYRWQPPLANGQPPPHMNVGASHLRAELVAQEVGPQGASCRQALQERAEELMDCDSKGGESYTAFGAKIAEGVAGRPQNFASSSLADLDLHHSVGVSRTLEHLQSQPAPSSSQRSELVEEVHEILNSGLYRDDVTEPWALSLLDFEEQISTCPTGDAEVQTGVNPDMQAASDQAHLPHTTLKMINGQPENAREVAGILPHPDQASAMFGCVTLYNTVEVVLSREQQQKAFEDARGLTQNPKLQLCFTEGETLVVWGSDAPPEGAVEQPGPRPKALTAIMMPNHRLCIVGSGKPPAGPGQPPGTIAVRALLRGTHNTILAPLTLCASSGGLWLAVASLSESVGSTAWLHVVDGGWWSPLMETCSYRDLKEALCNGVLPQHPSSRETVQGAVLGWRKWQLASRPAIGGLSANNLGRPLQAAEVAGSTGGAAADAGVGLHACSRDQAITYASSSAQPDDRQRRGLGVAGAWGRISSAVAGAWGRISSVAEDGQVPASAAQTGRGLGAAGAGGRTPSAAEDRQVPASAAQTGPVSVMDYVHSGLIRYAGDPGVRHRQLVIISDVRQHSFHHTLNTRLEQDRLNLGLPPQFDFAAPLEGNKAYVEANTFLFNFKGIYGHRFVVMGDSTRVDSLHISRGLATAAIDPHFTGISTGEWFHLQELQSSVPWSSWDVLMDQLRVTVEEVKGYAEYIWTEDILESAGKTFPHQLSTVRQFLTSKCKGFAKQIDAMEPVSAMRLFGALGNLPILHGWRHDLGLLIRLLVNVGAGLPTESLRTRVRCLKDIATSAEVHVIRELERWTEMQKQLLCLLDPDISKFTHLFDSSDVGLEDSAFDQLRFPMFWREMLIARQGNGPCDVPQKS